MDEKVKKRLWKVYDAIAANPKNFDMGQWICKMSDSDVYYGAFIHHNISEKKRENMCGTTMCFAGEAVVTFKRRLSADQRKTVSRVVKHVAKGNYSDDDEVKWSEWSNEVLGVEANKLYDTADWSERAESLYSDFQYDTTARGAKKRVKALKWAIEDFIKNEEQGDEIE